MQLRRICIKLNEIILELCRIYAFKVPLFLYVETYMYEWRCGHLFEEFRLVQTSLS